MEEQATKLIKQQNYKLAKELLEGTLKKYEFEEPKLYMLTGEANLKLGYLVIAEQMYTKALDYFEFEAEAST